MIKIVGDRKIPDLSSYSKHELNPFVKEYVQTTQNILRENGIDSMRCVTEALTDRSSIAALKEFFLKNTIDENGKDPEDIKSHLEAMEELFENTREQVLSEAATSGHLTGYSPVIGLSFPLHKYILMTNIFDSGVIPKIVSKSPSGTVTIERRILVTPEGEEIDMFKQQDKIRDAVDASVPFKEIEIKVPEVGETDILTAIGAGAQDNLSRDTKITAIKVKKNGSDDEGVWVNVDYIFTPNYSNDYDLTLMHQVHIDSSIVEEVTEPVKDVISGSMHKNRFTFSCAAGKILAVKVKTRRDTSNGLTATCSVKWDTDTKYYSIPDAIPLNVTISPEEIKDVAALYNNENQLTKIMAMLKDVMGNHKDDTIRSKLKESFNRLPETDKVSASFDFAPTKDYALDHVRWRHDTFFDALDSHVTTLLNVLNDPNMEVQIIGGTDIIRKITPTEYSYQSPANIGTVKLNFKKTVFTSDDRKYVFTSSQKIKDNHLTIILNPTSNERIIYQIMDYQLYIGNDIRNATNPTLPALNCFERWLFFEFQPVQGDIEILNPTGLRAD